jgi:lipopolysaccharide biosynthesis glycosyltransferase
MLTSEENKTIIIVATPNYKEYLYAFLESAKMNLLGRYEILVIHENLGGEIMAQAIRMAGTLLKVSFFTFSSCLEALSLGTLRGVPQYWRLVGPHIISKSIRRVVYLDLDTLILNDVAELYGYDMQGKTIAACVDYLGQIKDGVDNWKELKLDPSLPYFNSGMMLIDVERYTRLRIMEKVVKLVTENSNHLLAGGKWPQNDQYGLNVALVGDWVTLPQTYNYGSGLEYKQCKVLHFIGGGKPGVGNCRPEFTREFEKYNINAQ